MRSPSTADPKRQAKDEVRSGMKIGWRGEVFFARRRWKGEKEVIQGEKEERRVPSKREETEVERRAKIKEYRSLEGGEES